MRETGSVWQFLPAFPASNCRQIEVYLISIVLWFFVILHLWQRFSSHPVSHINFFFQTNLQFLEQWHPQHSHPQPWFIWNHKGEIVITSGSAGFPGIHIVFLTSPLPSYSSVLGHLPISQSWKSRKILEHSNLNIRISSKIFKCPGAFPNVTEMNILKFWISWNNWGYSNKNGIICSPSNILK